MNKKNSKFSLLEKGKNHFFITQNEDRLSDEVIKSLIKNNEIIAYLNLKEGVAKIIGNTINKIDIGKIDLSESPSFTELSLAISALTKERKVSFVLIDSIHNLLGYNEFYATIKYIGYLLSNLKNKKLTCILIAPDCESTTKLVSRIESEIDEPIIVGSFAKEDERKFVIAEENPITAMKLEENEINSQAEIGDAKIDGLYIFILIVVVGIIGVVVFGFSNLSGFTIKDTFHPFNSTSIIYILLVILIIVLFLWFKNYNKKTRNMYKEIK